MAASGLITLVPLFFVIPLRPFAKMACSSAPIICQ